MTLGVENCELAVVTLYHKWCRASCASLCLPLLIKLKTTTTVATSRSFQEDRIWLNGKEEDITHLRLQSCLRESESCSALFFTFRQIKTTQALLYSLFFHGFVFSSKISKEEA